MLNNLYLFTNIVYSKFFICQIKWDFLEGAHSMDPLGQIFSGFFTIIFIYQTFAPKIPNPRFLFSLWIDNLNHFIFDVVCEPY